MSAVAVARIVGPFVPALLLVGVIGLQSWRVEVLKDRVTAVEVQRDKARAEISAMNARTLAAAVRIRAAAQSIADQTRTFTKEKNDEIDRIGRDRDALLAELRSRPSRAAAPAAAPGADGEAAGGSTGARLFREDAEFLVREAADADIVRVALKACYLQYDAARSTIGLLAEGIEATSGRGDGQ